MSKEKVSTSATRLRPVDWPIVVGENLALPRTIPSTGSNQDVLAIADELSSQREISTLLRRAVELARDRIGIERAAVFLYDDSGEKLCGTWGTDAAGATTNEHHIFFDEGFHHRKAKAQALGGDARWLVFDEVPLLTHVDGEARVLGRGWNAITPILGRAGALGFFCNDAARSGAALDEFRQTQLAILSRLLGGLLEDLRENGRTLPWRSLLSRLPRVGEGSADSTAIAVVHALHGDSSLTVGDLAKRFGKSSTKLSQLFQEEMGVSIVEYRHRLRLERFFSLVDPQGGNLLQAALDAGFGSYAQFHRVFRELLGTTPKEYLVGRK